MSRSRSPWLRHRHERLVARLGASRMIGLRMLELAAGGVAGEVEAQRMVGEKIDSALALQGLAGCYQSNANLSPPPGGVSPNPCRAYPMTDRHSASAAERRSQ